MIDDFNKRQRIIDLGEEAEDEILESTGKKTDFSSEQYKKVIEACDRRSEVPTMDWCPDENNPPDIHPLAVEGGCCVIETDDNSEELMECVYKKELGPNLETVDDGVAVGFYDSLPDVVSSEGKPRWHPERIIDFTQDSEYKRLYGNKN